MTLSVALAERQEPVPLDATQVCPRGSEEFSWCPDWTGQTVTLVAAGPSANAAPLQPLQGRSKVVVINNSFKLARWADMLYSCDYRWWLRSSARTGFTGLKVSQDRVANEVFPEIKRVHAVRGENRLIFHSPGYICWGGNSGLQALNLVAQWNPSKILLVGYDMSIANGSHWHGDHKGGLPNPRADHVERWRRLTEAAAAVLQERGIRVFNCSMQSALVSYPKLPQMEALDA